MMFRKEMNENEAMLFVFAQPFHASFYMRNTIIPLSCAYLDTEGEILEIHDLKPMDETPIELRERPLCSGNQTRMVRPEQDWRGPSLVTRAEDFSAGHAVFHFQFAVRQVFTIRLDQVRWNCKT